MPCEDLFGWWTLRCGVWMVFLLALLGNGVVVVVLCFGRSKIDVPRFLVCNLAMADLFMGVYLGLLAVMDASTLGEFRVYAVAWQTSWACQLSGFLGVFSSELSVYTLAVITLERNYAITHAMHLNKRLSLKHASYIMSVGWVFALIMAIMPLLGVSDYRKFAVCLPFEIGSDLSKTYVICLIVVNGIAFLILMGCYLRMYCAIKGSQAWNSNDSRIAKRMALLVFTDFLCWAPIAFFSLTAVSGFNFISLEEAKIFTIFVLPLNSCCNPFLYAIFTKQFKKDCAMLCKRIEESRVTRGIGRGRNSSNFSNRQTPLNTNSAAEKRSATASASDHEQVIIGVCQCGLALQSKPIYINDLQHHNVTQNWNNNNISRRKGQESNFGKEKMRLKRSTTRWFWRSRDKSEGQESLRSNSVKSSNVTSDNIPSSPSSDWKQQKIPMRVVNAVILRNTNDQSQTPWNPGKRDSSQASSSFKTTSTTTRSSFSSSLSGSKTTESSLVRSVGHAPLVNSSSVTSNSLDDGPQDSVDSSVIPELRRHRSSNDMVQDSMMDPKLCHDCVLRREVSSRRGSSQMNISRNQALEEKLNLYFSKLTEAAAAAEHEVIPNDICKDESCGSYSLNDSSHSDSKTKSGRLSHDSKGNIETVATSETTSGPIIEVENHSPARNSPSDFQVNDTRDDVFLFPDREDSSRSPSTLSIRTQIPASRTPDLIDNEEFSSLLMDAECSRKSNMNQDKPSSHSLLDVRYKKTHHDKKQALCSSSSASFSCSKMSPSSSSLSSPKKVSSYLSLRKSLTSLPFSIIRSISSQGSHFLSNKNSCKIMSPSQESVKTSAVLSSGEEKDALSPIILQEENSMTECPSEQDTLLKPENREDGFSLNKE
jgi:hypothetical protein